MAGQTTARGITVAPLVGLNNCELYSGSLQIDQDLELVCAPEINLDQFKEQAIGKMRLDELKTAAWGFRHIYVADPGTHLDEYWKSSKQGRIS